MTINFYVNYQGYNYTYETMTGLYGQTLISQSQEYTWPSIYSWYYYKGDNTIYLTFLDAFINPITNSAGTLNLYADSKKPYSYSFYKQNLDETYSTTPTNTATGNGGAFSFTNKYNGFTVSSYSTDGGHSWTACKVGSSVKSGYSSLQVRFTRNSYTFAYYNYNTVSKKVSKLYEASLSDLSSYTPSRPAGLPSYYTFQGWYSDPSCTKAFDFSSTMPAAGVTVYAKWAAPQFTVTFYSNGAVYNTVTVDAGDTISEITPPTDTVKTFAGWVTSDGTPFSYSQNITSDLNLYATWMGGTTYKITYDAGGGTGTVPVDSNNYSENAKAEIKSEVTLTAPSGKVFVGWKSSVDGKVYYPGTQLTIGSQNITLTAQWADVAATTKIKYDYNGGYNGSSTSTEVTTLLENGQITSISSDGITRPGYTFKEWNTNAEGTGTAIEPNESIQIDNISQYQTTENVLYAIWTENDITINYISEDTTKGTVSNASDTVKAATGNLTGTRSAATASSDYYFTGWTVEGRNDIISTESSISADIVNKYAKLNGIYVATTFVAHFSAKTRITIKANDAVKTYDGTALTNNGYNIISGKLDDGDVITSATVTGSQTDAGASANTVNSAVIKNGSVDVTNHYIITYTNGTLKVDPVAIELTANSASKAYDGTALTVSGYSITSGSFVGTDGLASVTVTGSQTLVGHSDNTITGHTLKEGTNSANYTITYKPGTLEVTKASIAIKITANSNSKTYDGTALTDGGYTYTGTLAAGDTISSVTVTGSQTDAGSSANKASAAKIMHGTDDVTANYQIAYTDGTLKVDPVAVELTANSATKPYDGTALTDSGYSISNGKFVGTDGLSSVTVTGSQTLVGSSANTITGHTLKEGTNSANYAITYKPGTLSVTNENPIAITITANSASKTYDGTSLSDSGYKLTKGTLANGDTITSATVTGSQTDAGTSSNAISLAVIKHGDDDVTANYDITYVNGTLTVNPVAIELTANSDTKTYDGTALINSGYTITSGSFVGTDGLSSVTVTGSQTLVGSSANTITGHTLKEGTNSANYAITYKPGTLEVTKASIAITITANSASKTYDGTALTNNGYTLTAGTLAAGDIISNIVVAGSITDVGSVNNVVNSKVTVIKHGDTVVTSNYNITYVNGTLTVKPVAIELTANSDTKTYDGTALINSGYTITSGSFVGTDGLASVAVTGSQTLVGSSANTITGHTLAAGTKAGNYTITYMPGTLTVNTASIAITITANSNSKTYDGTALTDSGYTYTGTLANGDTISSVTVTGSQTDAGSSANKASAAKIMHGTDDVTANYVITYTDGTLTVNPVAIELTANSASKAYDGMALTDSGYSITSGSFVGTDGLASVTVTGSQTLVGSSANTITGHTLATGTKAGNYTITYMPGTLTVNTASIAIKITANSNSKTYDGTALTDGGYTYTGTLANGDTISSVTVTGSQTDAGSSANKASAAKIMHGTDDVTANYQIAYTDGTLKVDPVAVELTANSATKPYDGTALTDSGYSISNGKFVGTDGLASVTVTGSQTLVGSSANTITGHTLKEGTNSANYAITYKPGTLEVTNENPIAITITANSASKTYDGTSLSDSGYKLTKGTLANGDTITSVTVTGSQTDAGSSSNAISLAVIKHGDDDVTANYNITYVNGTLTVKPVAIELTANSDTKTYDGTALINSGYTITSGSFVGTDGLASVAVTGSQTLVGSSANTITGHTLAAGTKAGNYTITYMPGTLTVNTASIAITITANSNSKTYDGTALTDSGYTYTGTLANGDTISSVTVTGSQTDAGSSANKASAAKIMHGTDDVTANYVITYTDGTLTVNPVAIELTANSASKAYDGMALTDSGYSITSGSFVGTDGLASVTVTGSQTLVGSSANTITGHTLATGTKAGNYTITYMPGTLTVNTASIAIKITANSNSKTYDGTALTDGGYTYTGTLANGDTISSVTVTGSQTDAGSSANKASAAKIMHGTDDVTANYQIAYTDGTLKVDPVAVELTANSATKPYDGTALTDSGYSISNGKFVGTDGLASVTVTGSQTLVGSSANTITGHTLKEGTNSANYAITYKPGTLEVTKASIAITIKANSNSKTYDGTALTDSGYIYTGTLAAGDTISSVTVTGSQTDAGSSANVASAAQIMHGTSNVTENYAITYTDGTITVNPVAIELTADSASKAYDGTALTDSGYSITSGKFVGTDGLASVTVEGSQTLVGSSANTITGHTLATGTKAGNYTITYKPGTLSVTNENPIAITITANSASKTYDGTSLSDSGYKLTKGTLANGDTITSATVTGSQTDAGTSSNAISLAVIKHGDDDVTANYDITYVNGTLTVNPVAIELTANSDTKTYDGTALINSGYAITSGSFVGTDGLASVTVTGSQTLVGSSANTITGHTLATGTKTGNYTITYMPGTLTVNTASIAITITANSASKTYDSTALTDSGYSLTAGTLASGDTVASAIVSGSQTDAGSSYNTVKSAMIKHGDDDVTANYQITYVNGSLTVNPVAIELTADSASKAYDGTALTDDGYTITSGSFVGTDGLASVTVTGSQTLVGSSENTITGHTLTAGTKAGNYTITYKPGTLTVNTASIAITITANSNSKTYDGTALTEAGYSQTAGALAAGDTIASVSVAGTQTDAGSSANKASAAKIMHGTDDVTANYQIAYTDGTLKVDPVAVELTANSATKPYDGTALTDSGYSISNGKFVGTDGLASVTVEGSQTLAGSSANTITGHTLTNGTKAENYTITYKPGTLIVNKASIAITITANSASKKYDGSALSDNGYNQTAGTLATGDTISSVTVTGSQTDAGSSANVASEAQIMHGTDNVTDNYVVTYTDGTLTVNPVAIELTANSASKAYDGTALTDSGYSISNGMFVGTDGLASVTVEGSQTLVGSSLNTITGHTLTTGTIAGNYTITYKPGTLSVTNENPIAITITANSNSKTYDGTALTDSGYSLTAGTLADGDVITSATVTGSQTDAGTSSNAVTLAVIKHGNDDVTAYYKITYVSGSLTVNPVAIELTANSASKAYDGTALTDSGYSITSGKFVGTDGLASVTVEGSQTLAGSSANTITGHKLNATVNAGNYSITYKPGTLEVTKANIEITITANSDSKTYDGTALTDSGYSMTGKLATGDSIASVTVTGSQTDAGSSANVASEAKIMHGTDDVTENYQITYTDGKLTIDPVAIELTANSASKVYDNTALTDNGYSITSGALVGTDEIQNVTVKGSQTDVGKTINTASDAVLVNGTKDVTNNYDITYVNGTLEVLAVVRFLNYDGSVISTAEYHYGDAVVIPADPTRAPETVNGTILTFTFDGWDSSVEQIVTKSADYTAEYTTEITDVPTDRPEETPSPTPTPSTTPTTTPSTTPDNGGNTSTNNGHKYSSGPKTGDTNATGVVMPIFFATSVSAAVLVFLRKKKRKNTETK
jgi:uncharacterized repeat protein (TIGR02543 family)